MRWDAVDVGRHAAINFLALEYLVDRSKNVRSRAEGVLEFAVNQGQSARLMRPSKVRQHLGKGAWGCILKREDRLFLVSHGEDRSVRCSRTRTGKKFYGQSPDDLPLL